MSLPFKKKVLKIVLTPSHGQAEVECGFSLNKKVTVENLLEGNLVAIRLLCQFMNRKKVSCIVVSKEMLVSCGRAWKKYSKAMELKKKEAEMSEERLKRKRKHWGDSRSSQQKEKDRACYSNTFEAQKWQKMKASSQYESKIIVVGNLRAW